jgi:phosphoesterase RecJ-like protein
VEKDVRNIIKKIREQILHSERPLIITHVNPDGDAIGSALGLYIYLKNSGLKPVVISPNNYPPFLKWMPMNEDIVIFEDQPEKAGSIIRESDLIICLDFNDLGRLENAGQVIINSEAPRILIDHHPDPAPFADTVLSDTSVSSTAELVYEVISQMGDKKKIDRSVAACLFAGIMTDTGSFNFNSSKPATYRIVSELLELGIDKDRIFWDVYDKYSENRMRLMGFCLHQRMEVFSGRSSAMIYISIKDQEKFHYELGDSEGFVNLPLSIDGVQLAVFLIEKRDHVKMSFRSKGDVDVNAFARNNFNGGGHLNAAGGKSFKSLEETLDKVRKLLGNRG